MSELRSFYYPIQIVVGLLVSLHGVYRILNLNEYVGFVMTHFSGGFLPDFVLVIGSGLFPFLEFFTGLLICCNVLIRRALWVAFLISIIMSTFILIGSMYERLIYHSAVLLGLFLVYLGKKSFKSRRRVI